MKINGWKDNVKAFKYFASAQPLLPMSGLLAGRPLMGRQMETPLKSNSLNRRAKNQIALQRLEVLQVDLGSVAPQSAGSNPLTLYLSYGYCQFAIYLACVHAH